MKLRSLFLAGLAALSLTAPAAADDDFAISIGYSVYQHALGFAGGIMTDSLLATMELIAYQAAAAQTCVDYTIDEERLAAAIKELDHVNADDLSAEETAYAQRLQMMVVGMAIGGFLAEFAVDPDAFCNGIDAYIEIDDSALISKR